MHGCTILNFKKEDCPMRTYYFWLSPDSKEQPETIDDIVSAEIPNKDIDPILYELVVTKMIHGPCGTINPSAPCMKNAKCSKSFPQNFLDHTELGNDNYPKYRRRDPQHGGNVTKSPSTGDNYASLSLSLSLSDTPFIERVTN